ncbi:hypothetical protein NU08_1217 [Flavobacterium anhuiense]|uniref:Uncharacterized protein n=1 Tax=Flavobacterium anhuiense TaxID=459526 RepID=A0A444W1L2_9FLAO|nr:hypothetical protein NU08_1217 [Flavobacterium anhuiense]
MIFLFFEYKFKKKTLYIKKNSLVSSLKNKIIILEKIHLPFK